ncbi:MAG: HAMP domain-containing histidine kinase [Thermoleophilia bacterium]|nr:HAMP domain-containing histidine kinase [Thermoleophilia bacterium]MDH4344929.1 HAMP domain-containing histidine kinase [Thermoleophilia bacterium]
MSVPGGIRARLVLALVLIVGVAVLAAYVMVVPSLERRLVDAKLDLMQKDARTLATALATRDLSGSIGLGSFVAGAASTFDARVAVLGVLGPPLELTMLADSAGGEAGSLLEDPVALQSAQSGAIVRGRVTRESGTYAAVAVPLLPSGGVMVLTSSLSDQLATVRLVERSFALAALAAAGIALVLGSAAAAVHARRIRRLERAANRIAVGHFDEPVVDLGDDELGQLASAFDRMRVQLRQLDTARKEFVANASHELRTPLFSLAGFLELLADEDLDDATRERFLATTREQVDRLSRLAGDLLDLSRIDSGRLRVEHEEVSLTEIASLLGDELQPVAGLHAHSLRVDVDDDVWATADEERVLQVGRSLAVNALMHTPEGTTVVIHARRDGARATLAVEDDGPGIAPDHVERVFDRFYRGESATASGSGLGLAIARELAECMGGAVTVTTRPGRTVFTLALPAIQAPAASPEPIAVST